jgi:hypothetical protein
MKNLKRAEAWLGTMLSKEELKAFEGRWTVFEAGERLTGVEPMFTNEDELIFPNEPHSCGYNGGCSIFNSGEGFSVLSCDFDMYVALEKHFENKSAWIIGYNAGVWFDTIDQRMAKMAKTCGRN